MPTYLKLYAVIHLVPILIYKRKQIMKDPISVLKKFMIGYLKSLAFIGILATLAKYGWCFMANFKGSEAKSKDAVPNNKSGLFSSRVVSLLQVLRLSKEAGCRKLRCQYSLGILRASTPH